MVKVIVICPDRSLRTQMQSAIGETQQVTLRRELPEMPAPAKLVDLVKAVTPDLLLIGIDGQNTVDHSIAALHGRMPNVPVVTFGTSTDPELLVRLLRSGVRDHLPAPFAEGELPRLLSRLRLRGMIEARPSNPGGQLFAFLPAKPGAGTSTIAVNVSVALSKIARHRTLLMDADLSSGMVRFLLNLDLRHSLADAVDRAPGLDDVAWPGLVAHFGDLDVLPSATTLRPGDLPIRHTAQLCAYVKRRYRSVCADLSGLMEPFAAEILQSAKRILLVTTPELPSLYLASQKYGLLQDMDLGSRVHLIVNRCSPEQVLNEQLIEQIVGAPVYFSLGEDSLALAASLESGREVKATSPLGRQFTGLAQRLINSGDGVGVAAAAAESWVFASSR